MATFEVKVYPIKLEEHPNADALELAVIGDYKAIVAKDLHEEGDLIAYIPEQAILPDWLIDRMDLKGRLAGSAKNRVKAIKLRGILSQGLVVPLRDADTGEFTIRNNSEWYVRAEDGMDVTEMLDIVKYEPPVPVHMAGEVQGLAGCTLTYDIENIKKFPDVMIDGEEVTVAEKLHGTWACWGLHPEVGLVVTSKGLSSNGLAFKDNEANVGNLYMRTLKNTTNRNGDTAIDLAYKSINAHDGVDQPVYLLGEIFGGKVQDLKYGITEPEFRLFDVYVGVPGQGRYLNFQDVLWAAHLIGVDVVPILYRGPYSRDIVNEHTDGRETVSGTEACIREGVVVRPVTERYNTTIGRVQLKSVSEKYLLRKGDTTEYS